MNTVHPEFFEERAPHVADLDGSERRHSDVSRNGWTGSNVLLASDGPARDDLMLLAELRTSGGTSRAGVDRRLVSRRRRAESGLARTSTERSGRRGVRRRESRGLRPRRGVRE